MAKFSAGADEFNAVWKQVSSLDENFEKIFGGMTKAGADVVYENVMKSLPPSLQNSIIRHCIGVSVTYRTPSDDGINTKVYYGGYFENEEGKTVPAPLIINMFEYGSSAHPTYPHQPFFRKSFNKSQITNAMKKAQKTLSGGILDE